MGQEVYAYTQYLPFTPAVYFESALKTLPDVTSVEVLSIRCQQESDACIFYFHTYTSSGVAPAFVSDLSTLKGTDLRVFLTTEEIGSVVAAPEVTVTFKFFDQPTIYIYRTSLSAFQLRACGIVTIPSR